ncbi:mitochondrial-processing peptidase subunit alpha-like [Amphibalanus amphitrite]|uniref:mitochondrial-processing peptidase subunit alpha-like n=1 Tax=Amphibalanus amphitrite TaxID=1232801 RepID=UPI001C8FB1B6|nr:mitochondrial-processing peptidase subunit alpha-like [Amphibalanus amphitrite]
MMYRVWNGVSRGVRGARRVPPTPSRPASSAAADGGGGGSVDISQIPLTEPIPGLPTPVGSAAVYGATETQVTTLSNGLRVASEPKFGQHCTVGVVADAGSRYEVAYPSGISHFLEKLSFGATKKFKDRNDIMLTLERLGGICDCQQSRDVSIHAASAEARHVDGVVDLLSDVVLRPLFTEDEMQMTRMMIQYELEDIERNPNKEAQLMEMIHAAAFRENTLGLPKTCPANNVDQISRRLLYTYLRHHFAPSRLVVAGVGVEHQRLVDAVQRHFVDEPAIWEAEPELVLPGKTGVDTSVAQFTGGQVLIEQDLSDVSLGPSPMPELAHLVLGLESCSHHSADFVTTCVLSTLMGGGGSFSAGGPGKGMYSRLYTNVLNRHHWMYNATAFNHAYTDSGLFCIYSSAHPSQLRELCDVIVRELTAMAGPMDVVELERAKKQLTSMLLMNLEARPVQFEDIGRQVLATGHRKQPKHYIDQISRVTADDVRSVASSMLRAKPAMAALGSLAKLPTLSDIEAALLNPGRAPGRRRYSLF